MLLVALQALDELLAIGEAPAAEAAEAVTAAVAASLMMVSFTHSLSPPSVP
jgi:hypothetical protein